MQPEMFTKQYAGAFDSNPEWNAIRRRTGDLFAWDDNQHVHPRTAVPGRSERPSRSPIEPIRGARVLGLAG